MKKLILKVPRFVPKETPSNRPPALTLENLRMTAKGSEINIASLRIDAQRTKGKPRIQISEDDGFAHFDDNFASNVATLEAIERIALKIAEIKKLARDKFGEAL